MENDQTRVVSPQGQPSSRPPRAELLVIHAQDPAEQGRRYPLGEEDVTLGRDRSNTVVVPSESASRRHARIFASGGAHVLVDLESTNGTLLNGRPVAEQTLRNGDVIRVGSTVVRYTIVAEAAR
ncbi:MAG TPA: FHA domain-containing protein [Anaeromyxobacteraceae bacterium]|nr:FHA domain-containing protein [Anaeromyxobacteraceae bacterium]